MSQPEQNRPSLNGWNPEFVEDLYAQWRREPSSVGPDWQHFFQGFDLALSRPAAQATLPEGSDCSQVAKQSGVYSLIVNYRMLGHFAAQLDVLGENQPDHPLLQLKEFGLTEADLDTEFDASNLHPPRRAKLREIIEVLRDTYCGTLGAEYLHIQNTPERRWIQDRLEPVRSHPDFSSDRHFQLMTKLRLAEGFEKYLHTKFVGQKRFSLEGGESLIVALDSIVRRAADTHHCSDMILGMAHRGRLNVLANVIQKSYEVIFSEFEDNYVPGSSNGDGDVKYHKGYSNDHITEAGSKIHMTLTANPSHLEAVNPVVEGRVRAKQALMSRRTQRGGELALHQSHSGNGTNGNGVHHHPHVTAGAARLANPEFPSAESRKKVLPVLIHGDAAFPGQGIVWETLNLSKLDGYTTGGTIHIIINNQIGFTTDPQNARSTHYCTDVVKGVEAPIFHVNGDDVAAVAFVVELALDYRQAFGKDVVVDIYCYRKWGHNESDEPSFTQPIMYEEIRQHPGVSSIYAKKLIERGIMSPEDLKALDEQIQRTLAGAQDTAKKASQTQVMRLMEGQAYAGEWKGLKPNYNHQPVETGVAQELLLQLAERLAAIPEGFNAHPKIAKLMQGRHEAVSKGEGIDWATAEALGFGSLLVEGTAIRLSGQDSRRGTFSHRHSVLIDQKNEDAYTPLNNLSPSQSIYEVWDSPLSEEAVLGFEYGISLGDPATLVLWEAQFGDFNNGAQTIIDQFLASSESKWQRISGLVMLLPHGYEGQGPEHSSARMERFLQLCAEDNLQVCNLTTPAQYFHALRRQMRRDFRKPLVIMSPKSLLRHPKAVSATSDLVSGRFQEVLDDATPAADVRRVLLCSGKVYYDLLEQRGKVEAYDVALVRVEQLHPLNDAMLKEVVGRYVHATEFYWVQEEPANMGAWTYIAPRLKQVLGRDFGFIGRDAAASPATGSLKHHKYEQEQIVRQAIEARELSAAGVRV